MQLSGQNRIPPPNRGEARLARLLCPYGYRDAIGASDFPSNSRSLTAGGKPLLWRGCV